MKSILKSLYTGQTDLTGPGFKRDISILQKIAKLNIEFTETLSEEQKEMYETIEDMESERVSSEKAALFAHGFALGALIMIEVINSDAADLREE